MENFEVNIADPASIKKALDRATKEVSAKRRELEYWTQMRNRLLVLAGQQPRRRDVDSTIFDAVVDTVDKHGAPLRAAEVVELLPEGIPPKTISWSLWKAEQDGLIQKIDHGLYAALGYKPMRLLESKD